MVFNSIDFGIFFLIVYGLYLALRRNLRLQNFMLLLASLLFYGWWDPRFLVLLFVSITIDYYCAAEIAKTPKKNRRKFFLFISIAANLGILGFFKYFNFFAAGFTHSPLHIILPAGISFYTFQAMSYTIDVYRGNLKPAKRFLDFALFVTYFPQLVAGPIERASHLLPQILAKRRIRTEEFRAGCYLILWGLFQKVFVADNLARIVDPVFSGGAAHEPARVLAAIYAFAFQLYCDFAGYSNIARGLGKCMGFDIMVNFHLPYLAANPQEFWQRWHISLSTWLRDYLYIPLGGNRKGKLRTYLNLFLVMLLGGLWHGASWTFVIWGAYHGFLLVIYKWLEPVLSKLPAPKSKWGQMLWRGVRIMFFFQLWCLGLVFFRAESVAQALSLLGSLTASPASSLAVFMTQNPLAVCLAGFFVFEYLQFKKGEISVLFSRHPVWRWSFYIAVFHLAAAYYAAGGKQFIYFQF